jgi:hypothetical protein
MHTAKKWGLIAFGVITTIIIIAAIQRHVVAVPLVGKYLPS